MNDYTGPTCAICRVLACDEEESTRKPPAFCPMINDVDVLEEVRAIYHQDPSVREMALASAMTEASGYMKRTRIEDTIDFAKRIGAKKLGIAYCVGLMDEARMASRIFQLAGFTVYSVCCKTGSIPKEEIGLGPEGKVVPGYDPLCNPVGQAALLAKAGTQLNVLIGLCVGHDSLFFMHTKSPTTVLVAKDRVLGHNPVAALYTAKSYYHRLLD